MNALSEEAAPDTALLNLVSFKWLMAGKGWRVDLARLQQDSGYARVCAQRGLESGHPLLGERSANLLTFLRRQSEDRSFALSNDVHI